MKLKDLTLPFLEDEIEWRIGEAGETGDKIWATCLAYVSARAIMNRLDDVCGPENWRVEYYQVSNIGVMCRLYINCNNEWICKEDGAENTDIESFKGGISSALKRAGSVWGIGRYLYKLESGFAQIVIKGTRDARFGRLPEKLGKKHFYWVPPSLPKWALPEGESAKPGPIIMHQPDSGDANPDDTYRIPFGKFKQRTLEQVGVKSLQDYVEYLEATASAKNEKIDEKGKVGDFIKRAVEFIVAFETSPMK